MDLQEITLHHTKCCPVPSTSCDLCTWELWSSYVQWFRRRCIYKKIHYLTLNSRPRSHEVLPSTLDIMWPMQRQNLKLLLPKVYEEMHLQGNTLLGQGHTKSHPVPSKSCDLCTGKIWSCYFQKFMRRCIYKKIHYLTFDLDLGVKVTQNVTQLPLHHVIYASTKFEIATSNGLGGDTITRNVTDGRTHRGTKDWLWYEINIPYFSNEKAGKMKSLDWTDRKSEVYRASINFQIQEVQTSYLWN